MAIQNTKKSRPVKTTATGNAADTGMPRTPPAKPTRIRASDLEGVFQGGGQHDGQYGQNRYAGASSYPMDAIPESPMAQDLRTTAAQGADGGDVLSTIQKFGSAAMRTPLPGDDVESVKGAPASQLRSLTLRPAVPDSYGMASARSRQPSSRTAATIPGMPQYDDSEGQPVRQPAKSK